MAYSSKAELPNQLDGEMDLVELEELKKDIAIAREQVRQGQFVEHDEASKQLLAKYK